jgi:thiol-disulfide isomerase/thioredoxin
MPQALLLITSLLLIARLSLIAFESTAKVDSSHALQWQEPKSLDLTKNTDDRLFLIWFTADWCGACKHLNESAFRNKEIVQLINRDYIPVRVVDRKREEGKNSKQVQILQGRFHVSAYPTLVVTLADPDLDRVGTQVGFVSSDSIQIFLVRAARDANYRRGVKLQIHDQFAQSAKLLSEWLETTHWADNSGAFGALFLSTAYLGEHSPDKAKAALRDGLAKVRVKQWPYQLLRYFDLTREQTLDSAEQVNDKLALAHFVLAAKAQAEGDTVHAIQDFQWVTRQTPKDAYIGQIASSWLERLKPPGQHSQN